MEEAIKRLQEILKHPSDIEDKLIPLIVSTKREYNRRFSSYKNTLNQILYNINHNKERLENLKGDSKEYEVLFEKNYSLLESFEGYVQHYDKIKSIAVAHRNFLRVKDLHEKLENLPVEISNYENSFKNKLSEKLNEDENELNEKSSVSIFSEENPMLEIHQKVYDLEEFKYELVFYMDGIDRESFLHVQRKIIMIEKVCIDFMLKFLSLGSNFLNDELIKNDRKYLKDIEKVIIIEERRDELTRKVKKGLKSEDFILKELNSIYYWYINRKETNYKIKFECAMRDCVRGRFDKLRTKVFSLSSLEIVFDDIDTISFFIKESDEENESCDRNSEIEEDNISDFSKSITNESTSVTNNKTENSNIDKKNKSSFLTKKSVSSSKIVSNDSENLNNSAENETLSDVEEKNVDNDLKSAKKHRIGVLDWNDIVLEYHRQFKLFLDEKMFNNNEALYLLEFVNKYYILVNSKLKIPKETLGEELLSEREEKIVADYICAATSSLGTWIQNITNSELEKFYNRIQPPILDEENKYVSENFINLLLLIKQQLEPISLNKKIFTSITNDITKYCKVFSKEIIKIMEKDLIPSLKQKSKPGYEEYVIMMGNSGLKLTQYVSSLPQSQSDEVKDLGNIFLEITKESNRLLSQYIILTCKEVIDKIFTDQWYNEDLMTTFIITLEDFLTDYKNTMNEYMFHTFCFELINEITKVYLKQLLRKRAKIYEDCGYKLEKNIILLIKFFKNYTDEEGVVEIFDVFMKLSPLLGRCSSEVFVIELKSLLISFPDIKKDFIKNIVLKKDEINESEKRILCEKLKECFKEIKEQKKTLFSELKY